MRHPIIPGFSVRPIELADADAWAAYACLPEVKLHTSSTAANVEDVRRDIQKTLADEPGSPIRFVLEAQGRGPIVATVGFHTISALNGTAEVTYDVAPSHWGQGIATAACRAATWWAFEVRGWYRVQATTVLPHVASQRVLERCGFKREGLLRNFRVVRGEPRDYWLYAAIPGEVRGPAAP
jgi:[ribosomal protein S5]-alanine N-acetyltransferase